MSSAEEEDFLVIFRALGIILTRVVAEGSELTEALENLEPREKKALRHFQIAAEQCLGQLKGWTLLTLENIGSAVKSMSRQRKAARVHGGMRQLCPADESQKCAYAMFEKFDLDKDGILNADELAEAIKLTGFTDSNVSDLLEAADVNRDGCIDIHEFIVWLYSPMHEDGEKQKATLEELEERVSELDMELMTKTRALNRLEREHEREMEATHDLWKSIAKHAILTIDRKVDLETAEWLGNGKYGFVLKARRRHDQRELVVKMMGIRWAHLAAKEWQSGTMVRHENIVEYEEVMLHADNDRSIKRLLHKGYESGALKSKKRRSDFPDRFICLTQELMNRGTVQDWLDQELLLPGGEFVVLQKVACALAYMHKNGVTHNDIKPENIMLHSQDLDGESMCVKLGDLGLATNSKEVAALNNDFWQYGMTAFCITVGEKFGTRKYRAEDVAIICEQLSVAIRESGSKGKLLATYEEMPGLLLKVFPAEIDFGEVRDWPTLQGWNFFEGGDSEDKVSDVNPIAHARHRRMSRGERVLKKLESLTVAHACEKMD